MKQAVSGDKVTVYVRDDSGETLGETTVKFVEAVSLDTVVVEYNDRKFTFELSELFSFNCEEDGSFYLELFAGDLEETQDGVVFLNMVIFGG